MNSPHHPPVEFPDVERLTECRAILRSQRVEAGWLQQQQPRGAPQPLVWFQSVAPVNLQVLPLVQVDGGPILQ